MDRSTPEEAIRMETKRMDEDMRILLKKVRLIKRLKKNGGRTEEVAEDTMKEDNEWMKEVRRR
mgnify:CR=1 FL=1